MKRKVDPFCRRGLRESLEEYAARLQLKADRVRITWRAQGLNALADRPLPLEDWVPHVEKSRVRIAPGVGVPCGPSPEDVIELDGEEEQTAVAQAYTRMHNNEQGKQR